MRKPAVEERGGNYSEQTSQFAGIDTQKIEVDVSDMLEYFNRPSAGNEDSWELEAFDQLDRLAVGGCRVFP